MRELQGFPIDATMDYRSSTQPNLETAFPLAQVEKASAALPCHWDVTCEIVSMG